MLKREDRSENMPDRPLLLGRNMREAVEAPPRLSMTPMSAVLLFQMFLASLRAVKEGFDWNSEPR